MAARPPRQRRTVDRLLDATEVELREVGLEALTVRTVAQRAGVSPATAYTYFTSKDHLFAELFLRHLMAHPAPKVSTGAAGARASRHSERDDVAGRLMALTRSMMTDLDAAPVLAAAATRALLGTDPAVEPLRLEVGAEYRQRFRYALGDALDEDLLEAVLLTFLGGLLEAGMGAVTYLQVADQLDRAIAVIVRGR